MKNSSPRRRPGPNQLAMYWAPAYAGETNIYAGETNIYAGATNIYAGATRP